MINKANAGFTLLEILIAIAVFAIMAVMAYSGLKAVLDARTRTTARSERLAEVQKTLYVLGEDLNQAVARPVRDEYGMSEASIHSSKDGDLLALTRIVPDWTDGNAGQRLQRVSYRYEKDALYRISWAVLDRTQQSEYSRRKLMTAKQVNLRFFDQDWVEFWSGEKLPKAVEISFKLDGLGDIKRLIYVHD
jgi:general secretion pathway protein J